MLLSPNNLELPLNGSVPWSVDLLRMLGLDLGNGTTGVVEPGNFGVVKCLFSGGFLDGYAVISSLLVRWGWRVTTYLKELSVAVCGGLMVPLGGTGVAATLAGWWKPWTLPASW